MRTKNFTLSLFCATLFVSALQAQERSFLSNVGVSVNAGLTGIGASVSTPLGKHFTARAGFGTIPYTYKYTMDELTVDLSSYGVPSNYEEVTVNHDIDLKAKLKVPATHFLVDYNPFRGGLGAFHVTVGIFAGGSNLFHINGRVGDIGSIRQEIDQATVPGAGDRFDFSDLKIEIGDVNVSLNDNGSADAYMKVNAVRPYFGIGWGNAIPRNRVGFRFDIGAMYHGKPEITSPNAEGDLMKVEGAEDFNKILSKVQFWPQLSFQVTFRLLKD